MEEKEKIVLADGTEIEIENGAVENCVQVVITDLDDLKGVFKKFTEENLEKYQIKNAAGLVCSTQENKRRVKTEIDERERDYLVSFRLADVDMVKKRLDALEARQSNTEAGQELQDGAIFELGELVAGMMEGGEA